MPTPINNLSRQAAPLWGPPTSRGKDPNTPSPSRYVQKGSLRVPARSHLTPRLPVLFSTVARSDARVRTHATSHRSPEVQALVATSLTQRRSWLLRGVQRVSYQVRSRMGLVKVLHGVSASIRTGSLCAVLGPSGAGKSSLFDVLLGEAEMSTVRHITVAIPFATTSRVHPVTL